MTILRRSVISSLMMLSITPAAAALPNDDVPECGCAPVPPVTVSPTMAKLVADFTRLSIVLDAINAEADHDGYQAAVGERAPVLVALTLERPNHIMDLAAKMAAIIEGVDPATEGFALRALAHDAAVLAGETQ